MKLPKNPATMDAVTDLVESFKEERYFDALLAISRLVPTSISGSDALKLVDVPTALKNDIPIYERDLLEYPEATIEDAILVKDAGFTISIPAFIKLMHNMEDFRCFVKYFPGSVALMHAKNFEFKMPVDDLLYYKSDLNLNVTADDMVKSGCNYDTILRSGIKHTIKHLVDSGFPQSEIKNLKDFENNYGDPGDQYIAAKCSADTMLDAIKTKGWEIPFSQLAMAPDFSIVHLENYAKLPRSRITMEYTKVGDADTIIRLAKKYKNISMDGHDLVMRRATTEHLIDASLSFGIIITDGHLQNTRSTHIQDMIVERIRLDRKEYSVPYFQQKPPKLQRRSRLADVSRVRTT